MNFAPVNEKNKESIPEKPGIEWFQLRMLHIGFFSDIRYSDSLNLNFWYWYRK